MIYHTPYHTRPLPQPSCRRRVGGECLGRRGWLVRRPHCGHLLLGGGDFGVMVERKNFAAPRSFERHIPPRLRRRKLGALGMAVDGLLARGLVLGDSDFCKRGWRCGRAGRPHLMLIAAGPAGTRRLLPIPQRLPHPPLSPDPQFGRSVRRPPPPTAPTTQSAAAAAPGCRHPSTPG